MSELIAPAAAHSYEGFARVECVEQIGMISLRADLASQDLAKALEMATGCTVPPPRRIRSHTEARVAWMSPDELLVLLPMAQVPQVLAQLHAALAGAHVLAADVSDARAVFRVRGSHAQDVLAKLCPVDFAALAPDEIRRTRAAQAAVALWRSGPQEFTLISFRSVAGYVMDVLIHSARPGSTLGPT